MKNQIEQILQVIIGLPLWSIGRAGDLEWFEIGDERRVIPINNGETKIISEYALHVQCAWRIRNLNQIYVASRDRYYPQGEDPYKDFEKFDWDKPGVNRLDERISKLFDERMGKPLKILSLVADNVGGICLTLSDGYYLEVFPDDSLYGEYWRLLQPYTNKQHFVVTGHGFEFE